MNYIKNTGNMMLNSSIENADNVLLNTPVEDCLPIHKMMWAFNKIYPNTSVYNVPISISIKGKVDMDRLKKAVNEVVRSNDSFNYKFAHVNGELHRYKIDNSKIDIEIIDSTLNNKVREAIIAELKLKAGVFFDLEKDKPYRLTIAKIDEDEFVLLLVAHHIMFDEESAFIFFNQVIDNYTNPKANLLKETTQFVNSNENEEALKWWVKNLADAPQLIELPTDVQRPPVLTFAGGVFRIDLEQETLLKAKAICQLNEVSLEELFLSFFNILLYMYSGNPDMIIGITYTGRNYNYKNGSIGFMGNILPIRSKIDPELTFSDFTQQVSSAIKQGKKHSSFSMLDLINSLNIPRSIEVRPLFQVMFEFFETEELSRKEGEAQWELERLHLGTSAYDLTFKVIHSENRSYIDLEYNADIFLRSTIARIAESIKSFLEFLIEKPTCSINAYFLDSPFKNLSYNNSAIEKDSFVLYTEEETNQTIQERFNKIVQRYPEDVAVQSVRYTITYRELSRISNKVANYLIAKGGEKEGKIALLFEQDAPMISALLGAIKSGKTYIPLDRNFPEARLSYMISNSGSTLLLTNKINLDLAKRITGDSEIILLEDIVNNELIADTDPELKSTPENVAYILYTSGSTGNPKGVMQSHSNVLKHIKAWVNGLKISPDDKLTLFSSFSWDSAVQDLFGAILVGASVHPLDVMRESVDSIANWMAQNKITIYHSTLPLFRHLLNTIRGNENFPALRIIVAGGDMIYKSDVKAFQERFSDGCVLMNAYGATESTTALGYFISTNSSFERSIVPLGYPAEDTEVLLLNGFIRQNAINGIGEIVLKSKHVSLGYYLNADLTNEKFKTLVSGERLYYTGDLGKLLADGSIEYAGRRDFMVKIRGFRVEPGEIESQLSSHPGVAQNVVVSREDIGPDRELVAYIVTREKGKEISTHDLRAHLSKSLPDYMIPAQFVFLEELPLTPNRKIDRMALPKPAISVSVKEKVSARNEYESYLVAVWQELLEQNNIGVADNFFELGGHSLLAIEMFEKIKQKYTVDLPPIMIFQGAANIERIAHEIKKNI
jgi:amino acid adenylation domain-containing protein